MPLPDVLDRGAARPHRRQHRRGPARDRRAAVARRAHRPVGPRRVRDGAGARRPVRRRPRRVPLAGPHAGRGRQLGHVVGRDRRARRERGHQPVRVRRGRALAVVARHGGPGPGGRAVAGRPPGARPRRVDAAARRAARVVARPVGGRERGRPADRVGVVVPVPALRRRPRRAGRGARAGLGGRGRPAAARRRPPPGCLPRQEPLLDGLVLPGARRRGARRGRRGPARAALGRVRRAVRGGALRRRPARG